MFLPDREGENCRSHEANGERARNGNEGRRSHNNPPTNAAGAMARLRMKPPCRGVDRPRAGCRIAHIHSRREEDTGSVAETIGIHGGTTGNRDLLEDCRGELRVV